MLAISAISRAAVITPQPGIASSSAWRRRTSGASSRCEPGDLRVELRRGARPARRPIRTCAIGSQRAPAAASRRVERVRVVQAALGRLQAGVEVVQQPAQPARDPGALGDQLRAMIDQPRDLALRAGQIRDRQIVLADRRPRDRRSRRSRRTCRTARDLALGRHQLRMHPDHALAGPEQEPLERARDVAAVLDRPHPLSRRPRATSSSRRCPSSSAADRHVRQHAAASPRSTIAAVCVSCARRSRLRSP